MYLTPTRNHFIILEDKVGITVPRVKRLLFIYEPSFLLTPVVSVLELSEPARSIKFYNKRANSDIFTTI
jgi:hypothetical protein